MAAFHTREDMITTLVRPDAIIGEIGVFRGDWSRFLLDTARPRELHLIDPWPSDKIISSGDSNGANVTSDLGEVLFENVVTRFAGNTNVFVHRKYSPAVFLTCPDGYFDVLYIDGDHGYDAMRRDLDVSLAKTKDRGWIMGHDLNTDDVQRAVVDFCNETGLQIAYITLDGCPSFAINVMSHRLPKNKFRPV